MASKKTTKKTTKKKVTKKTTKNPGQFGKGNKAAVGNGRPKKDPKLVTLDELTPQSFNAAIKKFLLMSPTSLELRAKRKDIPTIDLILIRVIQSAIIDGDIRKLEYLISKIDIGIINLISDDEPDTIELNQIGVNQFAAIGEQLRRKFKK